MQRALIKAVILFCFIGEQIIANPFGPNMPPVQPVPLPTTPSSGSGNTSGGGPGWKPPPNNGGLPTTNNGTTTPNTNGPFQPSPGWNPGAGGGTGGGNIPPVGNGSWTPPPGNNSNYNPGWGNITLNYACPLVDQDSYGDLLRTLDALEQAIQNVPNDCKDDTKLSEMVALQKQMRSSANELNRIWNNPDEIENNLVPFDNELQTMIKGINFFSETLSANSLLNSSCGKDMMSSGNVLLALSDLVTGVAPFALLAASAGKSIAATAQSVTTAAQAMPAAVPYVLGAIGVAGVIKVINQMSKSGTLSMENYVHRQAVLKATCEYGRVATKIRYLKLAQSGQLEMLTLEVSNLNKAMLYTQQALGGSLSEILAARKNFYKQLDEVRVQMNEDSRLLLNLKKTLGQSATVQMGADDNLACSLGTQMVEQHQQGKFPLSISSNFKKLLNFGIQHDEIVLKAKAGYYDLAISELIGSSRDVLGGTFSSIYGNSYRIAQCSQGSRKFVTTLETILQTTEEEMSLQEQLYERDLAKTPVYKEWYSKTSILEKDRETLQRMMKTMGKASQDSTVMAGTEIAQRTENLRNILFGSPQGGWRDYIPWLPLSFKTKSPIGDWIDHTYNMYANASGLFKESLDNLMKEITEIRINNAKIQRRKKTYVYESIGILPKTTVGLYLLQFDYENFEFLSPYRFPQESPQQKVMCQRLEEIWLNWSATMDHLMAIKHVCSILAEHIDNKTGTYIVEACGRPSLVDGGIKKSMIVDAEKKLVELGYQNWATQVSKKLSELQCVGR